MRSFLTSIASLWLGLSVVYGNPSMPAAPSHDPTLLSARIFPESATLREKGASQRFLVIGRFADGLERDLTSASRFGLGDSGLASVDEAGKVSALADGETELEAEIQGHTLRAAVRVVDSGRETPLSFERAVSPVLTKTGCNGSGCHGGVKGRGGFKLSLNSLNPREDYDWIVRGGVYHVLSPEAGEPLVPRIDLAEPAESLLLKKPTFAIPHGGGPRFDTDSQEYEAIVNWVRNGAPFEPEGGVSVPRIEEVAVYPEEIVLDGKGVHRLAVTAKLSDGRTRDISDEVRYESQNRAVAKVDADGVVTAVKTGETNVLVRAAGHTVHARIGVIAEPIADYPEVPEWNFIDRHVIAKLKRFHLIPSELSDDSEFLRRVCLDVIGTLPPPNRVREFLEDPGPDKRNKLIEILLDSPEFVDFWTFRFADLLRLVQEPNYSQLYYEWIRTSIASNKPYDQMARERLDAQGRDRPSRHYYENNSQPERILSEELRVYTGRRFDCAQCHDHPFEPWSQDQFWGLAAFFGNLDFIGYYDIAFDNPAGGYGDKGKAGPLKHPRKKTVLHPEFLDGTPLAEELRPNQRRELAKWLTSHPYFAEAFVNRIWGYFFGRGIVDPVDDFKASNPPTHPELLKALAADFRENGHDLKRLIRWIVQSRTYQLSSRPNRNNRGDQINYSHFLPRPLEAEVLLDAISHVAGVPEVFHEKPESPEGQPPPGTRAIQLKAPVRYFSHFLDLYGRPMRYAVPERDAGPSVSQALHLYAGKTYTEKLTREDGRISRLVQEEMPQGDIIEHLYLASLSRLPTDEERDQLEAVMANIKLPARKQAFADLTWALLTSREFAYNH
ncbi:MAG: DUF1553 domain-containing protein [Candidatus Aminicenantes bacterium]|nr:DUF1553 domain-containing protein [Candidatus Aminicenantes bacterium]